MDNALIQSPDNNFPYIFNILQKPTFQYLGLTIELKYTTKWLDTCLSYDHLHGTDTPHKHGAGKIYGLSMMVDNAGSFHNEVGII